MAAQMSLRSPASCCHGPRLAVVPVCASKSSPQRRQAAQKAEQKVPAHRSWLHTRGTCCCSAHSDKSYVLESTQAAGRLLCRS